MKIRREQIIQIASLWELIFGKGKAGEEKGREHLRKFMRKHYTLELSERASRNELTAEQARAYILKLGEAWEYVRARMTQGIYRKVLDSDATSKVA